MTSPSSSGADAQSEQNSRRLPRSPAALATARCVVQLQRTYQADDPHAVAELARIRRGVGRRVHEDPGLWAQAGLEELPDVYRDYADVLGSTRTVPGTWKASSALFAEEAVHLAVTLWALHQQSSRSAGMHQKGWTLGRSVRALMAPQRGDDDGESTATGDGRTKPGRGGRRKSKGDKDFTEGRAEREARHPARKRLVRLGSSTSFDALAVRLRDIVVLLRNDRVPLDYVRLADQLHRWQMTGERNVVSREWGREFHLAAYRPTAEQRPDSGAVPPEGATDPSAPTIPAPRDIDHEYADDQYEDDEFVGYGYDGAGEDDTGE
ncbi:type I-E CRISPR-associated protein Cse2/CasB [Streptomyces sp. AJS327]|uniref:type I-E CRISPR-associated protein Cse2/CasB n=1 Tax=Streptomyces sp. AJS327 TaxID=2545265 RepID=UPI0015DFEBBA|nr:type I-E CRISPR-associated protein Cse2/CasB [Streptomyces sp. AJS327]MBA0050162.1 type I-E CRISPR-associated protein Cse2/CasB [Streptomyces sp. AJS327]